MERRRRRTRASFTRLRVSLASVSAHSGKLGLLSWVQQCIMTAMTDGWEGATIFPLGAPRPTRSHEQKRSLNHPVDRLF